MRTEEHTDYMTANLSNGKRVDSDVIIMIIGVRPETTLSKSAGLKLGDTVRICVDACMQTSDPDSYTAGDAIEVRDFVSQKRPLIPLADSANKQGRIIANAICAD